MANVLILSLIFSPDNVSTAQLMAGLAGELKARGHALAVITTTPHYHRDPSLEARQPLKTRVPGLLKKSQFAGIPVYHVVMPDKHCGKLLRILSWIFFHVVSTAVGVCIPFKADVILSPSPPLSIGINAYVLSRLLGAKYIYNVQELYPDIAVNLGVVRNRRLISWLSAIERFIYNHAAAVTTITDSIQEKVRQRIRDAGRVRMIPNYVADEDTVVMARDNPFARQYALLERFVVTYAGNLGLPQNLWLMFEAAVLLRDVPGIAFMIIGEGTAKAGLRAAVERERLTNIHVVDYQPIAAMPGIYAASDVFFVGQMPDAHTDGIPSKIYRIFGNRKPVLAVTPTESDLAQCVRTAGGGVVVSENTARALADAVLSLRASPSQCQAHGQNGYTYAQQFSRGNVSRLYDDLIRELTGREPAVRQA
jgi:colanic acid biosynthesis glycosyl transferase WcaI